MRLRAAAVHMVPPVVQLESLTVTAGVGLARTGHSGRWSLEQTVVCPAEPTVPDVVPESFGFEAGPIVILVAGCRPMRSRRRRLRRQHRRARLR